MTTTFHKSTRLVVALFTALAVGGGAQLFAPEESAADTVPACPKPTVTVNSGAKLKSALANAKAGTVIRIADGVYAGPFFMEGRSGTAKKPIWICGSKEAKLDNGSAKNVKRGAALRISGGSYLNIQGFTLRNTFQGLMAKGVSNIRIAEMRVVNTGYEGIHVYGNANSGLIADNYVANTGQVDPGKGEGIYLGTSSKRWNVETNNQPDRTRNITISGNTTRNTSGEAIEVKPGTSDGIIENNDAIGPINSESGALGAIVVGGNNYVVRNNKLQTKVTNGIRIQSLTKQGTWGTGNRVENNTGTLQNPFFGVSVHTPDAKIPAGLIVKCNNRFSGIGKDRQLSLQSRSCDK